MGHLGYFMGDTEPPQTYVCHSHTSDSYSRTDMTALSKAKNEMKHFLRPGAA